VYEKSQSHDRSIYIVDLPGPSAPSFFRSWQVAGGHLPHFDRDIIRASHLQTTSSLLRIYYSVTTTCSYNGTMHNTLHRKWLVHFASLLQFCKLPSARRHCTAIQLKSRLMQDCRINPHTTAELGPVSRRAPSSDIPLGHRPSYSVE
jgi:hypothetical protein